MSRKELKRPLRRCTFGHQPFVDYSVDFLYVMFPAWLRLMLALAGRGVHTDLLNSIGAQFDLFCQSTKPALFLCWH